MRGTTQGVVHGVELGMIDSGCFFRRVVHGVELGMADSDCFFRRVAYGK